MNRQSSRRATLAVIGVLVLSLSAGCSPGPGNANESKQGAEAPTAQIPTGKFAGKVVETMDAGTYTYVLLERGEEQVWAAGPQTALEIGDEIAIDLTMPMPDFESETLGRTFETVYFVTALGGGASGAGADPHAGVPGFAGKEDPHAGLSGSDAAETPGIDPGSFEVPEGGHRVADLWARRQELAGKKVAVRGRVVKFNGGILGRNWLHLQDGTGDAAAGSHDVTVTSDGSASVGDVVTAWGVVAVDRDFGAGYSYALIVEDATVEVAQ
jgi:hypothetical protein